MTGCRVKRIEKYIDGDNFFLTYGDGLSDVNIRLVEFPSSPRQDRYRHGGAPTRAASAN